MIKNKLTINISLILIVSGGFIALDLVQILATSSFNPMPSLVLKGGIVFLTTLLVLLINNHGINQKDTTLLKLIYMLIIFADLSLLLFQKPYMGIILFLLAQCLLIYRNSDAIFNSNHFRAIFDGYSIFFAFALTILLLLYLILIKKHTTDALLFILFMFYGMIKSSAVFTAILNFRFKVFPNINRLLLLIGTICFYFCDLNVGLTLIFNESLIQNISSTLIWIFYTPALTLIALSGYNFDKIRDYYN